MYKGFYDAGELDGTCVIGFEVDDTSIAKAIEQMKMYFGDNIHVLGGDYAQVGHDEGELLIRDAQVLLARRV